MTTDIYTQREALADLNEAYRYARPPDPRGPEDKRREREAKDRLKDWMEEEDQREIVDDETGLTGRLSIPEDLTFDRTDQRVSNEVLAKAVRAGIFELSATQWRAALKRSPTADIDALKIAIHTTSGTPRLTISEGRGR